MSENASERRIADDPQAIHLLSLGAGVQSSTLALMVAAGEVTPMPLAAIFADTQAEPVSVYHWLDWLEKQLPFPVLRVSSGSLADISTTPRRSQKSGELYLPHSVPAYTINKDGSLGNMFRICTDKHKLGPLRRKTLELANGRKVIVSIGISRDEVHRMKPSNHKQITHRWPLVEMGMTRQACLAWMQSKGHPKPPRSACTFCPYHNDREWLRLKTEEPEAFQAAVEYEKSLQEATLLVPRLTGVPYLHAERRPLSEVQFAEDRQPELFGNECEGMCGV